MSDVLEMEAVQETLVAVMDQYSTTPAESPLCAGQKKTMVLGNTETIGVELKELAFVGHMIVRGNAEQADFVQGVEKVLGTALPVKPLSSSSNGKVTVLWLTPDEWLILAAADSLYELEVALRAQIKGHISIVNQSGGQTIYELTGSEALNVLKKSTPLDVHPHEFPVGKVATSVLAKSSAIFYRVDETHWQLIVRRSFADYIWRWLVDASKEYGLKIES